MKQTAGSGGTYFRQKEAYCTSAESSDPLLVVEYGENLFLMGRFREALELSVTELEKISNVPLLRGERKTGVAPPHEEDEGAKEKILLTSDSVTRLVALVIQILFELNRHAEVTDFVTNFYGTSAERLPFQIFLLILNLQISLGNLEKAKRMVVEHLRCRKNGDTADLSCKGKEKQDKYDFLTQIQYNSVAELFVTRILIPLHLFDDAKSFVAVANGNISAHKAKILYDEIDKGILAQREAEKIAELSNEGEEEEEIQVDHGKEGNRVGLTRELEYEDVDDGGARSMVFDEEGDTDEGGSEDLIAPRSYFFRPERLKSRSESTSELGWSTSRELTVSSASSMVMQWASGLWQWIPISGGMASSSAFWICTVLSFVVSFFFLYLRRDIFERLPNVFGNLKELLSLAFNIDRSVTGSAMLRRRRLAGLPSTNG